MTVGWVIFTVPRRKRVSQAVVAEMASATIETVTAIGSVIRYKYAMNGKNPEFTDAVCRMLAHYFTLVRSQLTPHQPADMRWYYCGCFLYAHTIKAIPASSMGRLSHCPMLMPRAVMPKMPSSGLRVNSASERNVP